MNTITPLTGTHPQGTKDIHDMDDVMRTHHFPEQSAGNGTGSEMEQFTACLKVHDPMAFKRTTGSLSLAAKYLTDGLLLAKAREFYAIV